MSRLILLEGHSDWGGPWAIEAVVDQLPTCHICDKTPDEWGGWKLHSGSPICQPCIDKYQTKVIAETK